ncbi:hypothetical protein C8Q79DRAFT_1005164 [Trametes meyenii]|nr:hypothetical protein C8Q79DRAFT_1005164 [Trametes meyenii]
MSTFNVTGSASGVFTSEASVSERASSSVLPSASVVAASSAAPASGPVASVASGSSIPSAHPSSSAALVSSTRIASASPGSLSGFDSSTALVSSVDLSSSSIPATSAAPSSLTSSFFTSAPVQSRPGDKVPVPLPVSSTAGEVSFTGVSSLSSSSFVVSSVVPLPRSSSRIAISPIVTTPSVSRTVSDKVPSSVASAQSAGVSSSRDVLPTVKAVETSLAQSGTILSMSARPTDIASSTDDKETTHSASASGSSPASQESSPTPSETRAGNDPAPPSASSESSAVSSEASKPVSSPSRPSLSSPAPTLANSSSAAASVSQPVATQDTTPAGSVDNTPAPSLSQDGGNGASTTSLHAVSSPSAPTPSPTPASHGHTQSIPEIPFPGLPITRAAPVVHSTTAAAPPPVQTVGSSAALPPAVVPSSVSGPALTPLAQQNDVPVHGSPVASATGVSAADTDPQVHVQPSPAHLTPASPPSPSPAIASSDGGSKNFDTVQANAQTPGPTSTSTITEQPDTTLSSPHFVTVTDADHHTSLSVPPLFTSVIVSELPDGGLVSVTRIIANPTGIYGVEIDSKMGFFAHSGAVAGVFLVVGAVLAAIALGICLFVRRRRRRNPRFIGTISNPLPIPDNPFEDPRDLNQPQMRYASGLSFADRTLVIDGIPTSPPPTRPPLSPFDDYNRRMSSQSSGRRSYEHAAGLGLAGVNTHRRSTSTSSAGRTSSESRTRRPSGQSGVVGLAITSDERVDSTGRARRVEPSSARSSPSFYPPSLPTLPHDDDEGALVDIVLDAGMSKSLLNRTGSTPSVHSVTRKPVPSPEPEEALQSEPTPAPAPTPAIAPVVSPSPMTPAQAARPPVLPPRSPLRRNSAHLPTLPLSPPPYKRPTIALDARTSPAPPPAPSSSPSGALMLGPDTHMIVLKPSYEPLTPPTSLSSISPPGSSAGHNSPSPGASTSPTYPTAERANPFADVDPLEPKVQAMGPPGLPLSPRRDTFYTRRVGGQVCFDSSRREVIAER